MKKQVMFWKDGFYSESIPGSVEITVDYWNQLINGQSKGQRIVSDENGYPVLVVGPQTVEEWREGKIREIETYDKSDAINQFTIGGMPMWLSREERASLKIRFEAEKAASKTDTVLWFDGVRIPIPDIDAGLGMLVQLELYASACYDITQQHIAAVKQLKTANEINAYDHTAGYPDKLEF